jgi:hypothetical protein
VSHAAATFRKLSPAYKAIVALIAPIATIVGMLLALNVISPFGEDAFAAGVDRTTEAASAAVNIRYEATPENGPAIMFAADGAFDYRAGRGALRYDFSGTEGSDELGDVEVRFAGRQVYLKLADGSKWIHADLDKAREQVADYAEDAQLDAAPADLASIQDLGLNDPSQVLAKLRRASAVEELGEETVYGVATKRYRATIEPSRKGEQRIVATVSIDGSGLIRRLELVSRDGPSPFTMTMDLTEFGEPVDVRRPAPENVRELEELLDELREKQLTYCPRGCPTGHRFRRNYPLGAGPVNPPGRRSPTRATRSAL